MPTQEQLHTIASIINHHYFTPKMIREMFNLPGGDEELRLIVRDDIAGAADKIVNALWDL